jgi:hypothetical protein
MQQLRIQRIQLEHNPAASTDQESQHIAEGACIKAELSDFQTHQLGSEA